VEYYNFNLLFCACFELDTFAHLSSFDAMAELFRDAPLGQLIRLLTRNELLQYPEEMFSFNCPEYYEDSRKAGEAGGNGDCMTNEANRADLSSEEPDLERSVPAPDDEIIEHEIAVNLQRTSTQPFTEERLKFERRMMIERTKSLPVGPSTMADGTILVDWYTTDDPANPQNWSHGKKGLVALQIE
jgi:DHA1 family multidrug resistance protein-like MFS transporter